MTGAPRTRPGRRPAVAPEDVTAVLVTYGSRWSLLQEAIEAVETAEVGQIVVVDNGASFDVARSVGARFGARVHVVSRPQNKGSAAGYRSGLDAALEFGEGYLLLLDDDNVIAPDALRILCEKYSERVAPVGRANLVVVGFRPARQVEVASGRGHRKAHRRHSSVMGFSVVDVPTKLWRHVTRAGGRAPTDVSPAVVSLVACPYGGMFFHTELVRKFGMPDERFVLYADDTEYSGRITHGGGRILLIRDARIRDSEASWNADGRYSNSFVGLLTAAEDLRAYYSVRNNFYLATHVWASNRFVLRLNRCVFVAILWIVGKVLRRSERYQLLRRAIADGEEGHLGLCKDFPLP